MMIIGFQRRVDGGGYIGGRGNGIVTSSGEPSIRKIYLYDTVTMQLLRITKSASSGHYMFIGLDKNKKYLMIAREIEEKATNSNITGWDMITPATDLTIEQQQQLWASWQ